MKLPIGKADYEAGLTYLDINTSLYFTFLPKFGECLKTITQESFSELCLRETSLNVMRIKKTLGKLFFPEEDITTSSCASA
jgi:hypothetical protein